MEGGTEEERKKSEWEGMEGWSGREGGKVAHVEH